MNKLLEILKNIWDTFLVLSVLAILVVVVVYGTHYFLDQNKKVTPLSKTVGNMAGKKE